MVKIKAKTIRNLEALFNYGDRHPLPGHGEVVASDIYDAARKSFYADLEESYGTKPSKPLVEAVI